MGNKVNLIQTWNLLVDWGDFQTRKPTVKGVYAELDISGTTQKMNYAIPF